MGIGNGIGVRWGKVSMARGPVVNEAFEFTVQTDNAGTSAANQFTIPITSATPYNIETSDGQSITGATGATTLTFPSAGTYTVSITDSCEGWRFNNGGDKLKLLNISNWGVFKSTVDGAFFGASNMTCSAVDVPIHAATTMRSIFRNCTNFNGAIGNWDVSNVSNFNRSFAEARAFNQDLDLWDTSSATTLESMFENATSFNGNVSTWNTSNVTSMRTTFIMWAGGPRPFNQNLNSWDTSNVTTMHGMFRNCINYNQPLDNWNTSNVTDMFVMFGYCSIFNQPIGNWDVSSVTNMSQMFHSATSFNQPLNSWDVSSVTNMREMLYNVIFDQDISSWNVSNVNDFQRFMRARRVPYVNLDMSNWVFRSAGVNCNGMFAYPASAVFNTTPPIGIDTWTTTGMTNIGDMFVNCQFTGTLDVSGWDVSSVTTMTYSFWQLNKPIDMVSLSSWDTSNVTNMSNAFQYFNKASGSYGFEYWDISSLSAAGSFLSAATPLTTAEYDTLLVNWEAQAPSNAVSINFGGSTYSLGSAAETARTSLINTYGWTITDGGGIAAPFRFTVDTTQAGTSASDQFTIPITSATPYNISTSDGQSITGATGATTLTFPAPGTYTIEISDSCEGIRFNNGGDKLKLLDISSWGVFKNNVVSAFRGCANMTCSATDAPINPPTTMVFTFYQCSSFNGAVGNWDVSNVTDFSECFHSCAAFNQPLNSWDVSNATIFRNLFYRATVFNQPLDTWDTSNVTNMSGVFNHVYGAKGQFDQDISAWDVSSVTNFANMFNNTLFNQDISGWNVSNVSGMQNMFEGALFNQDISSWDTSSVTNMSKMFYSNNDFNQPIGSWNTSSVTNMREMLMAARGFDQDISGWDINQVTNFVNFGGYAGFSMTLSTANYDALLVAWEAQVPQNNISITFGDSQYTLGSAAETARTSLINTYGWTITDGGGIAAPLILRVDTSLGDGLPNMSLPMVSGAYDVDWGDGNIATGQAGSQTHAYATGGVYDIRVTGGTHLQYNFGADVLKVTNLLQWGSSAWTNAYGMFGGCQSMVITATDIPNWSVCSNFSRMFRRTTFTNVPNIDQWDMSNASLLSDLFWETACDPDISSWQITQVTSFNNFANAPSAFTTSNYDNILVSWEAQLQTAFPGGVGYTPTISIVFAGTQYTLGGAAEAARTSLINTYGWTITDGGGIAPAVPYTTDLVASYNFDSDFTDYTGNHPLTATGSVTAGVAGGKVSNAVELAGGTDYMTAADSDDFSFTNGVTDLPFTVSTWFYMDTIDTLNGQWLVSRRDNANDEYQIAYYQGYLLVALYSQSNRSNNLQLRHTVALSTATWYHITVTYDGSATAAGINVYLNGSSVALTDISGGTYTGMSNTSVLLCLGSGLWNPGNHALDGKMDETHIWKNRELTAAEVADIYNTENAGNSILPALPLLDTYTGAAAAYSLRDLSSSTTNVVRVRRSSDNTEQDFTSTQVTDGTLETFVGAGNDGFVTVWYDQSGNNYDISAANSLYQPQIVSSGILNQDNGIPYVYYNGLNQYGLSVSGIPSQTVNVWSTYYGISSEPRHTILNSNSSTYAGLIQQGSGTSADANMGSISYFKNNSAVTNTRNDLYTNLQTDGWSLVRMESVSVSNVIRPHAFDSFQNYWNGAARVNEFILFSNTQTNISGIETNINDYYTIY